MNERQISQCPDSPNCVQSSGKSQSGYIAPLVLPAGDIASSWLQLKQVILTLPRGQIVTEEEGYLRVELTSRLFRFVDDLELLLDVNANVVHLRSASRVGYYDFGANRRRVENIRRLFEASLKQVETVK